LIPTKNDFIEKYILPLFEPVVLFFGKYGVHRITVIMVPVLLIVLLAIKGELKSKSKSLLIVYFFALIMVLLAILKYQFFNA
jgi:hypothetical protein